MTSHRLNCFLTILTLSLFACKSGGGGGDEGGETDGTTDGTTDTGDPLSVELNGAVNKGPFVLGSSLDISPLDASGNPTGEVFQTSTISDLGEFAVTFEANGLVRIEADGFYYNEVTGQLSTAPISLRALYEISAPGAQAAYVNLITHLTHERVLKLIGEGMTPSDATTQAEDELLVALGIGPAGLDVTQDGIDLNINGGDDLGNAYLLAVSAVVAQAAVDRAGEDGSVDASLQELVNGISIDLQADGELVAATVQTLADAEAVVDPERVMELLGARLEDLGSVEVVPDINRVLDTDGDDIANLDDNCRWIPNNDQTPITDQVCLVITRRAGEASDADMSYAGDAAAVDVDDDGENELVASRDNAVRVFSVGEDGVLTEEASVSGVDIVLLDGADIDGDGKMDSVGLSPDAGEGGGLVAMLGDGSFQPGAPTTTTGIPIWGDWDDLDGDGDEDLVTAVASGGFDGVTADLTHIVGLSAGDGSFTLADRVVSIPVAGFEGDPQGIGAADLDGDGETDLGYTVQGPGGGVLIIAAGDGAGGFGAPTNTELPGNLNVGNVDAGGVSLQIADATGDGKLDLVGLGDGQVHVLVGDGAGNFAAPVSSPFGGVAIDGEGTKLGVGDVTGDGVSDLIGWFGTNELSIASGTGGGAFADPVLVAKDVLQFLEGRGFGDLDGNGTMDMAAVTGPGTGVLVAEFLINP